MPTAFLSSVIKSSSSIVRLGGTNNSADEISGESTGKWNSTLLLRAEYLASVFLAD